MLKVMLIFVIVAMIFVLAICAISPLILAGRESEKERANEALAQHELEAYSAIPPSRIAEKAREAADVLQGVPL